MASRGSELDRSHSYIGNFSVLDGVMVKISDKFRPPKKVSLPVGWRPMEMKKVETFDFTFEEEVIKMADQEKHQQESEKENLELASLIQETENNKEENTTNDTDNVDATADENMQHTNKTLINEIKEAPILEPMRIDHGQLVARGTTNKQRAFNFSEFEDNFATPFELVELQTLDDIDELKSVLQPDCVKNKTKANAKQKITNTKLDDEIDFSIFNTPIATNLESKTTANQVAIGALIQGLETDSFYVSRQTVPLSKSQDVVYEQDITTPAVSNSYVPLERRFESASHFENSRGRSYSSRFRSTVGPTSLISPTIATVYSAQIGTPSNLPPNRSKHSNSPQYQALSARIPQEKFTSLEWSKDSNDVSSNNSSNSVFKPSNFTEQSLRQRHNSEDCDFQRTNLNKSNSKSLPNLAEATFAYENPRNDNPQNENPGNENPRKSPNEFMNPVVSTSRIDNIMKQFQLNRLREFDGIAANSDPASTELLASQARGTPTVDAGPAPRHGVLPSLLSSPRGTPQFTTSTHSISPRNSNTSDEKRCRLSDDENNKSFTRLEPLHLKSNANKKGSDREKKLSLCEPLPPITTPNIATPNSPRSPSNNFTWKQNISKQRESSWLPDPSSNLSANDKTFVTMIAGMGFPKARTARAVLRLKDDEKEIIDFLVRVQQIAELGYDEDDVELALVDNKNDREKALHYLNLANKWKELGFPVHKIHDALSNTDKENETVFEYLTS